MQKPATSTRRLETSSECRVIQHRLGETCIPWKPQRIIALDVPAILDSLLALGIKPVGTTVDDWGGGRYFPALRPEMVAGIESVGAEATPSLEKILKLKSDLILLPEYLAQNYKQLSNIAPTVVLDIFNVKAPIKETFRYIAQLVGQEKKAAEVLDQYQKRIEEFQSLLGDRLEGLEVSVVTYYDGNFWFEPSQAPYFQVFQDIGLSIKPVFFEKKEYFIFSIEVIDQYDADILFIIDNPSTAVEYLSQEPLILSLKAVRKGKAYIVDPNMWSFYGPIGMNLFLDDLSKYLLEDKQNPYFKES
jgi:iron complex transport system substrate-binding protein